MNEKVRRLLEELVIVAASLNTSRIDLLAISNSVLYFDTYDSGEYRCRICEMNHA